MRIGVLILPAAEWREARQTWRLADQLGFDHAWTYDHIAWRDLAGKTWYSAVPTLAAAAMVTSKLRLGALVFSPNFRHPVPFAKEAATLSDISGGSLVLGLGAGASGSDARVLGGEPWPPRERADRFEEFVELTDRLLSEPVVSFKGRYYRASEACVDPAGTVRSKIPLAIAATGPRGMRLAARHADFWVSNGTSSEAGRVPPAASPELIGQQLVRLREICAAEGRRGPGLRTLLLNVNRSDSPLASVEAFRETVGRYGELGITDMVVPFPRCEPPFTGEFSMLERIASEVLPELRRE